MGFYNLSKEERKTLVETIDQNIADDLSKGKIDRLVEYFSDEDTYIRKAGYQAIGKIYRKKKRSGQQLLPHYGNYSDRTPIR